MTSEIDVQTPVHECQKRDKLPQQIIRSIRNMVLEGHLKPGDRLPSEQELTRQFAVSRPTMREVLRVLESQSLISIRQGAGGGIFVREVDVDVTRRSLIDFLHQKELTLQQLLQVRRLLDPYFAELAARVMSDEELDNLAAIVAEQRRHLDDRNQVETWGAEIRFHRKLARVCGNPLLILLQDFIETLLERTKLRLNPGSTFSEKSYEHHSRILEALRAHDAERARAAMVEDLLSVEQCLFSIDSSEPKLTWE